MDVATVVSSVVAVATHGHTDGVTKVLLSRCVPPNGDGAPLETSVTEGAAAAAEEAAPLPPELTVPPVDLMLCHDPLLSP